MVFDAIAMLVYIGIVYVWSLSIHPLGRDYALLEARGHGLPFPLGHFVAWEVAAFDSTTFAYHLVNLALLYGCMQCVYHFVRWTVGGPAWLGALAAVLFMANPVHSEAVLNLCGVVDLAPALFALGVLAAYAAHAKAPRQWKYALALALFALAVIPHPQNAFLVLALALFEWLVVEEGKRRFIRLAPFAAIAVGAWRLHAAIFTLSALNPARMFAPLYFLFYPLGFLPETARRFHEQPWLGWLAAVVVIALLWLIYRKARHPAMLFGLLAMPAVRLFQGEHFIDPVHMIGGGQLLLANALFVTALVALFLQMMHHPKWRHQIVAFTTMLCLVFFGLQIHAIFAWRHAAQEVKQFQTQAYAAQPDGPLGVIPDYECFQTAPLCLSASVCADTPFSRRTPVQSLLPLNYVKGMRVSIQEQTERSITLCVDNAAPLEVVPYPFTATREGAIQGTAGGEFALLQEGDAFLLRVRCANKPIPPRLLPASPRGHS